MKIHIITLLLILSSAAVIAQENNWKLELEYGYAFWSTGDNRGTKLGGELYRKIGKRMDISISFAHWQSTDVVWAGIFTSSPNTPIIDKYPDNYPYPFFFDPVEETDYGLVNLDPRDAYVITKVLDVKCYYKLLDKENFNLTAGLGLANSIEDRFFYGEMWSAEVTALFGEDVPTNLLIPLQVRYYDIGSVLSLDGTYKLKKVQFGLGVEWYKYSNANENYTVCARFGVPF